MKFRWQLLSSVFVVAFAAASTLAVTTATAKPGAKKTAIAHAAKGKRAARHTPPMIAPSLASLQHVNAAPTCNRTSFRLLIDVGHTEEAAGAVSARGMSEYAFNLTLARELGEELRERGFDQTAVMITEGKTRPGLGARVARINKIAPDLMLSIHHDSVPDDLIQKFEYDGVTRSYSDRFAGHSIFVSAGNPHYADSVLFARTMGNEMAAHGLRYTPHYIEKLMGERQRELIDPEAGVYRYDALLVLKNTRVPSVLLEAGSIINRGEEWKLRQAQYRAPIVSSISDAVELYCRFKPPSTTAVALKGSLPRVVVNEAAKIKLASRKGGKTRLAARAAKKYAAKQQDRHPASAIRTAQAGRK